MLINRRFFSFTNSDREKASHISLNAQNLFHSTIDAPPEVTKIRLLERGSVIKDNVSVLILSIRKKMLSLSGIGSQPESQTM